MDRHKFDTKLVADVIRKLPDCSFVLVGIPNPNVDPLREFNNVHFLGVKKHDEIPAYVANFDICILPTAQTEWGLKCRPLKLMEYLASNKPVLATPTPASAKYSKQVHISNDPAEWAAIIQQIISLDGQSGLTNTTEQNLTTWSNISDKIWDYIINNNMLPNTRP